MASTEANTRVGLPSTGIPRRRFVLWLPPLAIAAAIGVRVVTDWRRSSDETIRERLLEAAPLGSSLSEVEAVVKNGRWPYEVHARRGFYDQRVRPARVVGAQHIEANLGDYLNIPIPLPSNVTVFWGFDPDGRLIDVWVWKTTDGP
jgi:hypothetical protein